MSLLFVFSVKKKTKKNNEYMPGTLLFDAFIGQLSEQNSSWLKPECWNDLEWLIVKCVSCCESEFDKIMFLRLCVTLTFPM